MPTVTGTIREPDGTLATGLVTLQLVGTAGRPLTVAYLQGSNQTIEGTSTAELASGIYSITLPANDDIIPAGTRWQRTHAKSGPVVLDVATSPSTQREEDILADPPGTLATAALDLHAATTLASGAHGGTIPDIRTTTVGDWEELVFTTDAACPATALTSEHGQLVARGSGAGTGARSSRRSVYVIPNSPTGYSRMRSRWTGPAYAFGLNPQRGHAHSVGTQSDGKRRGVVSWHDIFFDAPHVFNFGIWESDTDGTDFIIAGSPVDPDASTISDGSRTSNVVTVTVPSGHGYTIGDVVTVDVADATFDGTFVVSAVTATTVSWPQTAGNDASCGAGTISLARKTVTKNSLVRSVAVTDAARTSGLVTATVPTGHPFQVGDSINVDLTDATYDGQFAVVDVPSTTQVRWRQSASDDASSGSGTVSKVLPYWAESEWRPETGTGGILRARVWPDVGVAQSSAGPLPGGPPPWESPYGMAWRMPASLVDPTDGEGCALVVAHLAAGSTTTEVRYDAIEAEPI